MDPTPEDILKQNIENKEEPNDSLAVEVRYVGDMELEYNLVLMIELKPGLKELINNIVQTTRSMKEFGGADVNIMPISSVYDYDKHVFPDEITIWELGLKPDENLLAEWEIVGVNLSIDKQERMQFSIIVNFFEREEVKFESEIYAISNINENFSWQKQALFPIKKTKRMNWR